MLGTLDYMAPEQAVDTHRADIRSDLYSLGCTLYKLLSGTAPFAGPSSRTALEKLHAHTSLMPASLATQGVAIPEPLQQILDRLLAKRPEDRFATPNELAAALMPLAAGCDLRELLASAERQAAQSAAGDRAGDVSTTSGSRALSASDTVIPSEPGTAGIKVDSSDAASDKPLQELPAADDKVGTLRRRTLGWIATCAASVLLIALGIVVITNNQQSDDVLGAKRSHGTSPGAQLTESARSKANIDLGQKNEPFNTPEFLQWQGEVSALGWQGQLDAVAKKLKEMNPGFDGRIEGSWLEGENVIHLTLSQDDLVDLSPVRVFTHLQRIHFDSGFGKLANDDRGNGKLADLSPLRGLPLRSVEIYRAQVRDLNPLTRLPLEKLDLLHCPVTDISPLKGLPLRNLRIEFTQVSDLSPLQGMKLEQLNCASTQVSDLSPLRGMALIALQVSWTRVSDLSPLQGMPLQDLNIRGTEVTDLSLLKDMPLKGLGCNFKLQRDTEILRSIKTLEHINGKPVAEFWKEVDKAAKAGVTAAPVGRVNAQWVSSVAELPAQEQVRAVASKLQELNPGFDGQMAYKIEEGAVTQLTLPTINVTNIEPLLALKHLTVLFCHGEKKGRLTDLTPLRHMKLVKLELHNNKGLSDLSTLRDLPLERLVIAESSVTDLSPLKDMPLQTLQCWSSQDFKDLRPLQGIAIEYLSIQNSSVADLSPLQGMRLKFLACHNTPVSDLAPLRGMPLVHLSCAGTAVIDLAPLKDVTALEFLDCKNTRIASLAPLADLPLSSLDMSRTAVSDLSPLAKCRFGELKLDDTPVSDLSPLAGMPLTTLHFRGTRVSDLSPLRGMPLKELCCKITTEADAELVRSIKSLVTINDMPAAEFWLTYDKM